MSRYVVFSRERQPAEQDVERIMEEHGVTVIDNSMGRMLLVEASEAVAEKLRERLRGWMISEEIFHPRPDQPRHRIGAKDPGQDSEEG